MGAAAFMRAAAATPRQVSCLGRSGASGLRIMPMRVRFNMDQYVADFVKLLQQAILHQVADAVSLLDG